MKWPLTVAIISLAIGLLLAKYLSSPLALTLLTQAAISAMLATAVGLLLRKNGTVSFGHAAFYGIGGYAMALLVQHGVPVELAILLALALPTLLAFALGFVIVRVPGVAFSMLTLAVGQAMYEASVKARGLTGGDDGMTLTLPETIFGLPSTLFQDASFMLAICWTLLTLVLFGLYLFSASNYGKLIDAIRENEERARFIGYRTVLPRVLVFALSAFVAACAGVLFALYNVFLSPDVLHWSLSGSALIMAIIGGPRLLLGPAFGAMVFFVFKDVAGNATEHWPAMIGATLIVVTVLLPMGLGGAVVLWVKRIRGDKEI